MYPGWRNLLLCLRDLRVDFVPLSMIGTKNQQLCLNVNFMTKGYRSSHNETAASAWQQRITTPIIQKILQPIDVE